MPQPLLKPTQIESTPLTLHQTRKEHAARIGLIASEWSILEGRLSSMLSFGLFGLSPTEGAAAPIVGAVFAALDSVATRLLITGNLLQPRISKELYQHFHSEVAPEIRRRATERNTIVHGYWGISQDFPDHIILSPRGGGDFAMSIQNDPQERMLYTVSDLEDIAKRIKGTTDVISTFQFQVIHEHTPLPFLPPTSKPRR